VAAPLSTEGALAGPFFAIGRRSRFPVLSAKDRGENRTLDHVVPHGDMVVEDATSLHGVNIAAGLEVWRGLPPLECNKLDCRLVN